MGYLIKNVRVINSDGEFVGDVLVGEGKIQQVSRNPGSGALEPGLNVNKEIDGTGKILIPGLWDPHVHFREPGFTHKEDFASGSRAAVSAGVTTVFDMPNTDPPTFTRELLDGKRALVGPKSMANFGLYFGAGPSNLEEIQQVQNVPGVKLYLNTTTGNLKMDDENLWRDIFRLGRKVSLHAEGDTFARAVEIWQEEGEPCELHLCHASLRSEVDLVRKIKSQTSASQTRVLGNLNPDLESKISMEVCPHHLLMTIEDRKKHGPFCCMKPELATEDDIEALWEGIQDGTIDILTTDHAPHTREEKESGETLYGIPGVETLFPLMFTEFVRRKIPLTRFVEMTSAKMREIFHVQDKKGRVDTGWDADLVLIDPKVEYEIHPQHFFSKCDWTPFEGFRARGRIEKVFLRGEIVFEEGRFAQEDFRGTELDFEN